MAYAYPSKGNRSKISGRERAFWGDYLACGWTLKLSFVLGQVKSETISCGETGCSDALCCEAIPPVPCSAGLCVAPASKAIAGATCGVCLHGGFVGLSLFKQCDIAIRSIFGFRRCRSKISVPRSRQPSSAYVALLTLAVPGLSCNVATCCQARTCGGEFTCDAGLMVCS